MLRMVLSFIYWIVVYYFLTPLVQLTFDQGDAFVYLYLALALVGQIGIHMIRQNGDKTEIVSYVFAVIFDLTLICITSNIVSTLFSITFTLAFQIVTFALCLRESNVKEIFKKMKTPY